MNPIRITSVILITCLSILSCSKETPTSFSEDPTILLYSTFEGGDGKDFYGWKLEENDSLAFKYFKLSHDVSPDGGSWSLMLLPDTTRQRHIYYSLIPRKYSLPQTVYLTTQFRAVGKFGSVGNLHIWSGGRDDGFSALIGVDSTWKTITLDCRLSVTNIDSIVLEYHMYLPKIGDTLFIDNIKLRMKPPFD